MKRHQNWDDVRAIGGLSEKSCCTKSELQLYWDLIEGFFDIQILILARHINWRGPQAYINIAVYHQCSNDTT